MWGAIHSAELGDGTHECENPEYACAMVRMLIEQPSIIEGYISDICFSHAQIAVRIAISSFVEKYR